MKTRIIALYLPQFHPIPENDLWWGPGFTEWTNVAKAKPQFRGHHQPRIPADLGFYDLRLEETRIQQAELAREAGIEGFCYYHYWFGGKQLLERPFNEVVQSGRPDFPFCLCWANHSWSNKTWNRKSNLQPNSMLMEQTYPGKEDDINHFMKLLPAFRDHRYMRMDGKPIFVLYEPMHHPGVRQWIETWRELAEKHGLGGLYLIGMTPNTLMNRKNDSGGRFSIAKPDLDSSAQLYNDIIDMGFDAVNSIGKRRGEMLSRGVYMDLARMFLSKSGIPIANTYDYSRTVRGYFAPEDSWERVYPTILPQWDRTPRVGNYDGIYVNATPEAFQKHIEQAIGIISHKPERHRILFLKSWNEWGEGNYVEPDTLYGHGWLEAIRKALQ